MIDYIKVISENYPLVKDGRDIKLAELQALNTKTATIMAATTEADIDAVV